MPRYYLHLKNREGVVEDLEGSHYADVSEARDDAIEAAREIMAERVLSGQQADGSEFLIADKSGHVLLTVPFETAMASE